MSKKDEIIFGAKRAGVTWLYAFHTRAMFNQAKAGAKRLGLSLSQLLCGPWSSIPPELPVPRKFTEEDQKSSTLKIQITEIDEFTRTCLERQAAFNGYASIEESIIAAALMILVSDEEQALLDPRTREVVLTDSELGHYIGCNVDKGAPPPPPAFTRIPIPHGAIVESCRIKARKTEKPRG